MSLTIDFTIQSTQSMSALDAGLTNITGTTDWWYINSIGQCLPDTGNLCAITFTTTDADSSVTYAQLNGTDRSGPGVHLSASGSHGTLTGYAIFALSTGLALVELKSSDNWDDLDTHVATISAGDVVRLAVEAGSGDLVGYLNGVEVMRANDTTYTGGADGLVGKGSASRISACTIGATGGGGGDTYTLDVDSLTLPLAMTAVTLTYSGQDTQVLSENNCTVTIQAGSTITYGQHLNNAGYGVLCDQDIYIIASTPTPTTTGSGRAKHGGMVNPTCEGTRAHGLDSAASSGYSDALNVALSAESTPYLVAPTSGHPISFIKVASLATPSGTDYTTDAMVVTFYHPDDYPADITDAFRPAYHSHSTTGKFGLGYTSSSVNQSRLRNHDLSALSHPLASGDATTAIAAIQKVQLHVVNGWTDDNFHPTNHMDGYSRDFAYVWGVNAIVANSTYKTDAGLYAMVQLSIDLHGKMLAGGTCEPDGGEGGGRGPAIAFGGWVLNNSAMYAMDDATYPGGPNLGYIFGERGQLWWATVADNGRGPPNAAGTYGTVAGLPLWGVRHATNPTLDNPTFAGVPYEHGSTNTTYFMQFLALYTMGVPLSEDYDPTSGGYRLRRAYSDRFLTEEAAIGGSWLPQSWEQDAWAAWVDDVPASGAYEIGVSSMALTLALQDVEFTYTPPGTPSYELAVASMTLPLAMTAVTLTFGSARLFEIMVDSMSLTLTLGSVRLQYSGASLGNNAILFLVLLHSGGRRMISFRKMVPITKHDTTNFTDGVADAIYVGEGGDVVAVEADGTARTIPAVAGGYILLQCKRVNSTNTTATSMFACYA